MMPFSPRSIKEAFRKVTSTLTGGTWPERIGTALGLAGGLIVPTPGPEDVALAAAGGAAGRAIARRIGRVVGGGIVGRGLTTPTPAETIPGMPEARGFMPLERAFVRAYEPPVYTPPPTPAEEITPTPTPTPVPTPVPRLAEPPITAPREIRPTAPRRAPRAGVTRPPAPRVAGGAPITGGTPTAPVTGLAGFEAPTPTALPPTPSLPAEMPPATPTPENMARFEALIRALQELGAGAYLPMPTLGGEPFGPARALERALRRTRERELGLEG